MTKIEDAVVECLRRRGRHRRRADDHATIQSAGNQVADTISGFEDLDAKGELESAFKDADEL